MATDNATVRTHYAARSFAWPFRVFLWVILFIAALWGGTVGSHVYFSHRLAPPGQRLEYAQRILRHDMEVTTQFDTRWVPTTQLAWAIGREAHDFTFDLLLFGVRSVMNLPDNLAAAAKHQTRDLGGDWLARDVYPKYGESMAVALSANWVFGARIATLIAVAPFVLALYLVGWSDGWAGRAIRRACAGRESSALYHRAKVAQMGVFALALMAYLALPYSFNPFWLLAPAAILCALGARMQVAYYKKYL